MTILKWMILALLLLFLSIYRHTHKSGLTDIGSHALKNLHDIEYSIDQQRSGDMWGNMYCTSYSNIVQYAYCY